MDNLLWTQVDFNSLSSLVPTMLHYLEIYERIVKVQKAHKVKTAH